MQRAEKKGHSQSGGHFLSGQQGEGQQRKESIRNIDK